MKTDLPNRVRSLVPRLMHQAGVPGLSIAVVEEGNLASSAGFGYVWLDRYESIAASGHGLRDEGAGRRWPAAFAAFSLYTTAIDYALFLIQLIRNEEGPRAERNILTGMLTPQIRVSDKTSWGLGVGLESTNLGEWFWHWGDMATSRASRWDRENAGKELLF